LASRATTGAAYAGGPLLFKGKYGIIEGVKGIACCLHQPQCGKVGKINGRSRRQAMKKRALTAFVLSLAGICAVLAALFYKRRR